MEFSRRINIKKGDKPQSEATCRGGMYRKEFMKVMVYIGRRECSGMLLSGSKESQYRKSRPVESGQRSRISCEVKVCLLQCSSVI